MPSVIYGSATKPPKTLFVANSLLYCEVFGAVALTVLAREPMLTVVCAVASHAFCIGLTNREPHINNILRNAYWRLCETAGFKITGTPRFKTKSLFKETGFCYEL